jgi:SAM-dependent methyltransferase
VARQNVYDDPEFFAGYRNLRDNLIALHETVLQPMLPGIVPDLHGKEVVDLGCGDGFYCRFARTQGAAHVTGVDPSEKMLAVAHDRTDDHGITYVRAFAEDAEIASGTVDVVVSILALHYVSDLDKVLASIYEWLGPDGEFIAIVEHPVNTASDPGGRYIMDGDEEAAWILNHYFDEGIREQEWYIPGVIKYHRKLDTMINSVIAHGFAVEQLAEPCPTSEIVVEHPRSRGDSIRPSVLGIRARKPSARFANPS